VKIGAENKKQLMWMTALLAIAVPLSLYSFRNMFGDGGSHSVTPAAAPSAGAPKAGGAFSVDSDPRLRTDLLILSRQIKYQPGRNIFDMQEQKIEPAVASVRQTPNVPYGPNLPPPPPPPPPIPLKFYGFASKPGETKKIFLQQQSGEQRMFVAVQGEVVDRRYKVIQIQANSVVMEDMLTNNRQPIPLTPR
jgi:hypothetical protein